MTQTPPTQLGHGGWDRIRDRAGLIVAWSVWGALTVALLLFVRQYSRNIPFWDDFEMVPVMTGVETVSLRWAWAQHNEHRPVISRLILAGLSRFVSNDFRAPRYANVALLSAMAAASLVLARRVRGSSRLIDAVLPLAILNVAQVESLMIGFAMNLILTSLLAIATIVVACRAHWSNGRVGAIGFGVILVLLPLSGGSGMAMLPPLGLWLAGYLAVGWWSGRMPGLATRAIGLTLLAAGAGIVALYLWGYTRPPHHPLPPSVSAVASSTLLYLSLAVYPHLSSYWWPASMIVFLLLASTLTLLAIVGIRTPAERPRALALMAVILSMLCVAGAVGISRAGLGSAAILASRYVTLTIPLFCALYFAWLAYGNERARVAVHAVLLAMMLLALPDIYRFSRGYGWSARVAQQKVERGLIDHIPTAQLMVRACPAIYPDPATAQGYFRMLKAARMGAFAYYDEGSLAATPDPTGVLRR